MTHMISYDYLMAASCICIKDYKRLLMAFAAVYAKCFVLCPKDKALLEVELSKWERKAEKQLAV